MSTNLKNHGTSFHGQVAQHSDQNGLACRALCGCSVLDCDRPVFVKKSGLCHRHYDQEWYLKHAEQLREDSRRWRLNHPEKAKEAKKKSEAKYPERKRARYRTWALANPKRKKLLQQRWEAANPGRHSESTRKWRRENKDQVDATRRAYMKERRRTDPQFRVLCNLRSRIGQALRTRAGSKAFKTMELLGCSIAEFVAHLEAQWKRGMSWENYGHGKDKWNIDHIIPCDSFDLLNPTHQRTCFHYSNQRPLWQPENCAKGNLVGNAQIPLL